MSLAKHKFAILLSLLLLLTAFASITAAHDAAAEAHKAAIEQVYAEAFNAGNLDVIDEAYAEEYVNHGFGDDLDREGFKGAVGLWRSVMPDFTATSEVLIAEGDFAASLLIYRGTFQNEWQMGDLTIEPNGEPIEWSLQVIYRFDENGKVVEEFTSFDRLDLLMQLDAAPGLLAELLPDRELSEALQEEPAEEVDEATLEAHRDTFIRVIEEGINNGDRSAIETSLAEDHIAHEPFGDFTREQFADVIAGFRAAVPDLHVTIEYTIAEGNWVMSRLIYEGTLTNSIAADGMTVEATGQSIRFIVHVLVRFNEDGLAVEDWKEYNRIAWLQQVGILPAAS